MPYLYVILWQMGKYLNGKFSKDLFRFLINRPGISNWDGKNFMISFPVLDLLIHADWLRFYNLTAFERLTG